MVPKPGYSAKLTEELKKNISERISFLEHGSYL